MTDFELFQNKAELEKLGLSENPADVVEDDTELEEDLFDWGEEMPSSENEFLIPAPVSPAGAGIADTSPVKAEIVEEDSPAAVKAAGYLGPLPPIWRPFLPYPLTPNQREFEPLMGTEEKVSRWAAEDQDILRP